MRLSVILLLCVVLFSLINLGELHKTKYRTQSYKTKYTRTEINYAVFHGFEILPGSSFTTPDGCLKCKCDEKFLTCKSLAKGQKAKKRRGCFI